MTDAFDFAVSHELAGLTVLAALRRASGARPWSVCRRWIELRRVLVNGVVCVNEARRLNVNDRVQLLTNPLSKPTSSQLAPLVFADEHFVVVEKPAGVVTIRRSEEQHWPQKRKQLCPTLDELVLQRLSSQLKVKNRGMVRPILWRVQRLDRDTSGLVVFARTAAAAQQLIPQFAAHTVERVYYAAVAGSPAAQTIRSRIVRDRGDGLRGSSRDGKSGQLAVTHIRPLQHWGALSLVECRLETGRTHQIRIHLAELGHPVCGDTRYRRSRDGSDLSDESGAPRLALHAVRLAFQHPHTGERLSFTSPWPDDLAKWRALGVPVKSK